MTLEISPGDDPDLRRCAAPVRPCALLKYNCPLLK